MVHGSNAARPVIFGEVLFDRFDDGREVLGGAPFNVAWHLRGFGLDPLFVGRVGTDEQGETVRDRMAEWGMDAAALQDDLSHATGLVKATVEDGKPRYEIVEDRAWDFLDTDRAAAEVRLHEHAFLYHGSLALRSPRTREALERIRSAVEAPIFCDVNLRPPHTPLDRVRTLLDRADLAKMSDEELTELGGEPCADRESCVEAAVALRARHDLQLVLVTLGENGAFTVEESGVTHADAAPIENMVDTVGAGDAFAAVFLLGIVHDWPRDLTLRRAASFAATVCGLQGATTEDTEIYRSHLSDWENDDA